MIAKIDIVKSSIKMFEKNGIKFSVLDIAKDLSTSKRTIYNFFASKEALIQETVDFLFDEIDDIHHKILLDNLDETSKLKMILLAYPKSINLDNIRLDNVMNSNPKVAEMIKKRLTSNWGLTIGQLEKCIQIGVLKNVDSNVFRELMLSIFNAALKFQNHKKVLGDYIELLFSGLAVVN